MLLSFSKFYDRISYNLGRENSCCSLKLLHMHNYQFFKLSSLLCLYNSNFLARMRSLLLIRFLTCGSICFPCFSASNVPCKDLISWIPSNLSSFSMICSSLSFTLSNASLSCSSFSRNSSIFCFLIAKKWSLAAFLARARFPILKLNSVYGIYLIFNSFKSQSNFLMSLFLSWFIQLLRFWILSSNIRFAHLSWNNTAELSWMINALYI